MKTATTRIVMHAALLCALEMAAQTPSISRPTISAGSGAASHGPYSLRATVGQPAASVLVTNGVYALAAGVWAVPTPGAPRLGIERLSLAPSGLRLSWPSDSAGFVLQHCTNLATPVWFDTTNAVTDDGALRFIVVPASAGPRYYRLMKP